MRTVENEIVSGGGLPVGLQIRDFDQLLARAKFFSESKLIPANLWGKPADVAIILQMGIELGLSPMQALNSINVIQGKPALPPELQLAMIYNACPSAYIKVEVDLAKLVATVTMARDRTRLEESYTCTWDMPRAALMGLTVKDNYKKQPATMLRWRAVGEAARIIFPDVTKGLKNIFEYDEETNTPPVSKADDLAALLTKEEPKTVESVVEPINLDDFFREPEVQAPGDYVIANGIFQGTALKDMPVDQVKADIGRLEYALACNRMIGPKDQEFLKASREFLALNTKGKTNASSNSEF